MEGAGLPGQTGVGEGRRTGVQWWERELGEGAEC